MVVTGGEKLVALGGQSGCPEIGKVKEEPFMHMPWGCPTCSTVGLASPKAAPLRGVQCP